VVVVEGEVVVGEEVVQEERDEERDEEEVYSQVCAPPGSMSRSGTRAKGEREGNVERC